MVPLAGIGMAAAAWSAEGMAEQLVQLACRKAGQQLDGPDPCPELGAFGGHGQGMDVPLRMEKIAFALHGNALPSTGQTGRTGRAAWAG